MIGEMLQRQPLWRQEVTGPETVAATGVWEMILRGDTGRQIQEQGFLWPGLVCTEFHIGMFLCIKGPCLSSDSQEACNSKEPRKSELITKKQTV